MADDRPTVKDHAHFRAVMSSFATGVTVISTHVRDEIRGMTANAFMSGSLEPPLCVISVGKTARMHAALQEAGHFGVSILTQAQQPLVAHFSGRPDLSLTPAFDFVGRTPVLRGSVATLTADIAAHHECGDHSLFIGHILQLTRNGGTPLVIHSGRVANLLYSGAEATDFITDMW